MLTINARYKLGCLTFPVFQVIQFLYKGTVDFRLCSPFDLKQAAEFLDIPDLYHFVVNRIKRKNLVGLEKSILKPVRLHLLKSLSKQV